MGRRGRLPAIDPTRTHEVAEWLTANFGNGLHLARTHRMGWLLRELEAWPLPDGKMRMTYVDVDQAPDDQLEALLLRHQERQRPQRGKKTSRP